MKPNPFRSIYNALAEEFPLLPRIRRSFIGLLMMCIIFGLIGLTRTEGTTVSVKPAENGPYANRPVCDYEAGHVQLSGYFQITHPSFFQKLLLPDAVHSIDLFFLLFMAIGSIIIILIVPKLQQQNLFRKDISNSIRLLGYLIMLHGILSIYRITMYVPEQIEQLTNNEFTTSVPFPIFIWAELYFSLVVLALGSMYKRGIQLQEEQDLTV